MTDNSKLSGREIEILQLVSKGLTNREIAQMLTISPNTVKVHLSNIFEKISVSSRTEATLYGIEHGLVDVPGGGEATAPKQSTWQELLRKYAWFIIPLTVLMVVLVVIFAINLRQSPPATGVQPIADLDERWQVLAPMPEARAGMATAAYDGEIYAIAGEAPEGVSSSVFRYSPDSDTWSRLSDKPTPVMDVQSVLIGEKIYVPGGLGVDGHPNDILEIYDPRRDTWIEGAPLPQPISAYALVDYEGQMYLFGGWDGENALDVVYIYDPQADQWRQGTGMGTARSHAGAAEVEGKIYIIGGRDANKPLNINESYNPQRDIQGDISWQQEIPLPEDMRVLSVQEIAGFVFVFAEDASQSDVIIHLNTQSTTWNYSFEEIPFDSMTDVGITSLGENLVILGGKTSDGELLNTHLSYKAVYIVSIPIINR